MENDSQPRKSFRDILGLVVICVFGLGLFFSSWEKWADVLIDFGQSLYVAWRISEGSVLYRDLAHNFGPLTPYLSALWFKLFGVSVWTLVVTNLFVTAGITTLIFRLIRSVANQRTAILACMTFLSVFGFAHWTREGNCNYVTPYTASATYGVLLGLACIDQFGRFSTNHQRKHLIIPIRADLSH